MEQAFLNNDMLCGRSIHVVGLGSLGGPIVDNLFRRQVPELHLWDFDIVETRNRFNQRVLSRDIGQSKIDARILMLQDIYPESATKVVAHPERVLKGAAFAGIVFCCVDWNRIRYEEVWPNIKNNPEVSFFSDGRVGMDGGKAYGLDPNNPYHIVRYEDPVHKHPDPVNGEAEAACKSEFPMPENAEAVASEMLWRLTRWLHLERGCADPYDNFIGWQNIPRKSLLTEQWDSETIRYMETHKDPATEEPTS